MNEIEKLQHMLWIERRNTDSAILSDYARPFLISYLRNVGRYDGGGCVIQWFGKPTPFRYSRKGN